MGEIILTPLEVLLKAIRKEMKIDINLIKGRGRHREVSEARQMFCHLARLHTDETTTTIGKAINRDHSSVVYSHRSMSNLCDSNKRLSISRNYIEADALPKMKVEQKVKVCEHCKQVIHE